jgi:hypothetical protein
MPLVLLPHPSSREKLQKTGEVLTFREHLRGAGKWTEAGSCPRQPRVVSPIRTTTQLGMH